MDRFASRRDRLLKTLARKSLHSILVTNFSNVSYLTGFTGDDSALLVTTSGARMISDSRYTTQIEEECPQLDMHIRSTSDSLMEASAQVIESSQIRDLAIEANSLTVDMHAKLSAKLKHCSLASTSGVVEELRAIKDKEEIAEIQLAARYAEKAFAVLRATLRADQTEKQVADDLEHQMRLLGAKGCSFPPIVAVGDRAALPHARPTERKIGDGDFVLVDWGATARQYKSDLTRVLATSKISSKLERVYGVVFTAQARAIEAMRPGVAANEIDGLARQVIADAGFGKYFGHGLGHGVGLDIHEAPRLSVINHQPLKAGMVITVEPGIYLPGWGGVRIEDDVLITRTGHEVLTSVPKQLEEVVLC